MSTPRADRLTLVMTVGLKRAIDIFQRSDIDRSELVPAGTA